MQFKKNKIYSTLIKKGLIFNILILLTSCEITFKTTSFSSSITDITNTESTISTSIDNDLPYFTSSNYISSEGIHDSTSLTSSLTSDPYVNVNETEFYANYTIASSYLDAYYRSQHGLMSGAIEEQDQVPTISSYQPVSNGKFIKNTSSIYEDNGNTYCIIDAYGNIVNRIYKGGGYVILEEVAAYIFAFNTVPENYVENKYTKPTSSIWGKYLRLNHSYFSGNTSSYPYEPEFPNIRGNGGDLYYYEVDVGTTGTDCDPSYEIATYNDGKTITRGAARIVYSRYDKNKNEITDINQKYLFYTYNHYNDFQEYLNYQGGWGEMFGNITGGGTLSSKTDYNPTSYVEVIKKNLYENS